MHFKQCSKDGLGSATARPRVLNVSRVLRRSSDAVLEDGLVAPCHIIHGKMKRLTGEGSAVSDHSLFQEDKR